MTWVREKPLQTASAVHTSLLIGQQIIHWKSDYQNHQNDIRLDTYLSEVICSNSDQLPILKCALLIDWQLILFRLELWSIESGSLNFTKSIVIEDVVRGDAGYIIVPMVIENLSPHNDIEEYKSNCKLLTLRYLNDCYK